MNTIMAQSLLPDSLVHRLATDTIAYVFPDTPVTNISLDTINFYPHTLKLFYKGFFLKNNLQYRFLPEQKKLLFLQPFQKNDTVMILFKKLPFPEIKIHPEDFFIEIPDSTQDSLSQVPTYSIIQRFEKAISEDVSDLKKADRLSGDFSWAVIRI